MCVKSPYPSLRWQLVLGIEKEEGQTLVEFQSQSLYHDKVFGSKIKQKTAVRKLKLSNNCSIHKNFSKIREIFIHISATEVQPPSLDPLPNRLGLTTKVGTTATYSYIPMAMSQI